MIELKKRKAVLRGEKMAKKIGLGLREEKQPGRVATREKSRLARNTRRSAVGLI